MIITYQGDKSFKISQGELSLVINPKAKTAADVTVFTSPVSDFAKATSDKAGFIITGPGEYEVKDIFIKGFPDRTFLITFESIKLCFLGSKADEDEIEDVDILFVPINAYKQAVPLEPALMIPMNYNEQALKLFLKEAGEKGVEPIEKLVVKKKDLADKEGEIIVLKEE